MKLFSAVVAVLFFSLVAVVSLRGYRSAFEADQACHAEKWQVYGQEQGFDCDHDLETNQWILYEVGSNHQAAKVLKRFHY